MRKYSNLACIERVQGGTFTGVTKPREVATLHSFCVTIYSRQDCYSSLICGFKSLVISILLRVVALGLYSK